jgi:hypothetical protein
MIDHQIYRKMHQRADGFTFESPSTQYQYDRRPDTISKTASAPQDVFLLLPPDTYGFYLTEKKWSEFVTIGRVLRSI